MLDDLNAVPRDGNGDIVPCVLQSPVVAWSTRVASVSMVL